jgi:hypothetical protein
VATILDKEATIKTAVVEIKALTVGGRQVTLALFRQLQWSPLIDEKTLEFTGQPWGRVNYHVDCDPSTRHLHVVWQQGSELRRACVEREQGRELAYPYEIRARGAIQSAFLQRALTEEPMVNGDLISEFDFSKPFVKVSVRGIEYPKMDDDVLSVVRNYWGAARTGGMADYRKHQLEERVRRSSPFGNDWKSNSVEDHLGSFQSYRDTAASISSRWDELYRELEALDQLFIAV